MESNSNEKALMEARSALADKKKEYEAAFNDGKMLKDLKELRDQIRKLEEEIQRLDGKA
jgi:hypothetical protein